MNIGSILGVVTRTAGVTLLKAQKHSPEILLAAGVVGVVTSGVMASRATLKLAPIVDTMSDEMEQIEFDLAEKEITESEKDKAIVKAYGRGAVQIIKLYGPSVTLGVASIACILGGHHIMRQRNAALVVAYKALETSFQTYRKRVEAEFGVEKEREIYRGQRTELVKGEDGKKKAVVVREAGDHSPYGRFFDEVNAPYHYQRNNPAANLQFVTSIQRYYNQKLKSVGYVFLNEIYHALGMEETPAGQLVGWIYNSENGDGYIDFGIDDPKNLDAQRFIKGDEPAVFLDFNVDGVMYQLI